MDRYVTPSYSQREKIFSSLVTNQAAPNISASYSQLVISKAAIGTPVFDSDYTSVTMLGSIQNVVTLEAADSTHQGKGVLQNYQAYDDSVSGFNYETGETGSSGHVSCNGSVSGQQLNAPALLLSDVISPGGIGGTGHIFDDIQFPQKLDGRTLVLAKDSGLDEGGGIAGTGHVHGAQLSSTVDAADVLAAHLPEAAPAVNMPYPSAPQRPEVGGGNVIQTDSSHQTDNLSGVSENTSVHLDDAFIFFFLPYTICPGIRFNDDGTIYFVLPDVSGTSIWDVYSINVGGGMLPDLLYQDTTGVISPTICAGIGFNENGSEYTILPNIDITACGNQLIGLLVNNDVVSGSGYDAGNFGSQARSESSVNQLNINDVVDQSGYLVI